MGTYEWVTPRTSRPLPLFRLVSAMFLFVCLALSARSVQAQVTSHSPIANGRVYLMSVGVTGYGSLGGDYWGTRCSGVCLRDVNNNLYNPTDSSGNFSLGTAASPYYSCPSVISANNTTYSPQMYLVITGGGSSNGPNNLGTLIEALGPCNQISGYTSGVTVNEVTTVATVWAFQQFMTPPSGVTAFNVQSGFKIGTPGTNLQGIANAFSTMKNLVDPVSGTTSATMNTVASPEYQKINTLADMLGFCSRSSMSVNPSNCGNLFASVVPAFGLSTSGVAPASLNAPQNTVDAAWYLAQFPANTGGTGACGTSGAAYQCKDTTLYTSYLTAEPNDWTLAVGYIGGTNHIGAPFWVAIDKYGNAWLTNHTTASPANSVVELGPNGVTILGPTTGFTAGTGSGYAGVLGATYGFTQPSSARTFSQPRTVTIDSNNNAWVANYNDTLAISGGTYTCPVGDTCDYGTMAEFPASPHAGSTGGTPVGFYTGYKPFAGAADAAGNVYVTTVGTSVTPGSKLLFEINGTSYTVGGGLGSGPYSLAIDNDTSIANGPLLWATAQKTCAVGAGYVGGVSQLLSATLATTSNSAVAGTTGCSTDIRDTFTAATGAIQAVAVDASNNLWLVNPATLFGTSTPGSVSTNTVTYAIPTPSTGNIPTGTGASATSTSGAAGLNNPQYVAVDGAGNAWVSNLGTVTAGGVISAFHQTHGTGASVAITSIAGANGFIHGTTGSAISSAEGIAIDLSGNVWVANNKTTTPAANYVTVLVGAAVPTGPVGQGLTGTQPESGQALPVITSFQVNQPTVNMGDTPSLSWTVQGATSTQLLTTCADYNSTDLTHSGCASLTNPSSPHTLSAMYATTAYTLVATNSSGSVISQLVVPVSNTTVTQPAITENAGFIPRQQGEDNSVVLPEEDNSIYFTWAAKVTPISSHYSAPNVPGGYLAYSRDNKNVATIAADTDVQPEWVVYQCTYSGSTYTPKTFGDITGTAYGFQYGSSPNYVYALPLDITNPDVLTYYKTLIDAKLALGYPVLSFDNVALKNWDHRCGHYNHDGSAFTQQFQPNIAYDPVYMDSVLNWMQEITAYIHSKTVSWGGTSGPGGVAGNITYPIDGVLPTVLPLQKQLVETVDIWLEEDGVTKSYPSTASPGYLTDDNWDAKFNFVRSIAYDRIYTPEDKLPISGTSCETMLSPSPATSSTCPSYVAADQGVVNYAVANFLLHREQKSLLEINGLGDASSYIDPTHTPALGMNVHLCTAASNCSPTGLPYLWPNGVWQRTYPGDASSGYTQAIVLVNPSLSSTQTVPLPTGTWTVFNPLSGAPTSFSGTASLGVHTGLILQK